MGLLKLKSRIVYPNTYVAKRPQYIPCDRCGKKCAQVLISYSATYRIRLCLGCHGGAR